jgi:uncharacterized protein (UPF0548 family)
MFLLTKPSAEQIGRFISSQREAPFSYPEVGASRNILPVGYAIDHNRVKVGTGCQTFARAVQALEKWKQFDLGWVKIVPAEMKLEVGSTVAIRARTFGFWSLSACRVIYVINEDGPIKKFGFAYGTLPKHVELGEERFIVEWHSGENSVWYDILAFSRPHHPLVKLAFPLARLLQKRFARDSLRQMTDLLTQPAADLARAGNSR